METARSPLASIRRFVQRRATGPRCELCAAPIAHEHQHLLDLASRQLCCACSACAILFSGPSAAKYRRVSRRTEYLSDFHMTDLQWLALDLPINLAFFTHDNAAKRCVACYPSPGGATQALPPPDAWHDL